MGERLSRVLGYTGIAVALAWLGWSLLGGVFVRVTPGDHAYRAGSQFFTDGLYAKALSEYDAALRYDPQHLPALRGRAETLIMLGREREAIAVYDGLIARQPDVPGHYANRGIAYDRLGRYAEALTNYEKALSLDARIGEGPDWLTRFLRNQPHRQPGIAERARYLGEQLALPPARRLLRVPEQDAAQRPYRR